MGRTDQLRAEQLFGALLVGNFEKAAELSPYTKAVLDMSELSPEDEARLDQMAVSLAPREPATEIPAPEPLSATEPEPMVEPVSEPEPSTPVFDPGDEPEPRPIEDPGSLPHVEHDDVPTEELHVDLKDRFGAPAAEKFRADFGWMFGSDYIVPDAYRIILALKYKENWLDWEPETLWSSVRSDFGPLGDVARGKIMALRTCLKTNTPWIDWDAFEHVSQAFNDGIVLFGLMQPPELEDAAYTVTVLRRLGDWPFGAEVSGYMAAVCLEAGLVYAPEEWFPSAQYFINKQSAAPKGLVDTVEAAWEKLGQQDLSSVTWRENNPVDNQVKKLWSIKAYLDGRMLQPKEEQDVTVLSAGGTA